MWITDQSRKECNKRVACACRCVCVLGLLLYFTCQHVYNTLAELTNQNGEHAAWLVK